MKAAANTALRWHETADVRQGTMCSEQQAVTDIQTCAVRWMRWKDQNCREERWLPHILLAPLSFMDCTCQGVPSGGQYSTTIVVGAAATSDFPEIHFKDSWPCEMWVAASLPHLEHSKGKVKVLVKVLVAKAGVLGWGDGVQSTA